MCPHSGMCKFQIDSRIALFIWLSPNFPAANTLTSVLFSYCHILECKWSGFSWFIISIIFVPNETSYSWIEFPCAWYLCSCSLTFHSLCTTTFLCKIHYHCLSTISHTYSHSLSLTGTSVIVAQLMRVHSPTQCGWQLVFSDGLCWVSSRWELQQHQFHIEVICQEV